MVDIRIYVVGVGVVHIYIRWSTQTYTTTCNITIPTSSQNHIPNSVGYLRSNK